MPKKSTLLSILNLNQYCRVLNKIAIDLLIPSRHVHVIIICTRTQTHAHGDISVAYFNRNVNQMIR